MVVFFNRSVLSCQTSLNNPTSFQTCFSSCVPSIVLLLCPLSEAQRPTKLWPRNLRHHQMETVNEHTEWWWWGRAGLELSWFTSFVKTRPPCDSVSCDNTLAVKTLISFDGSQFQLGSSYLFSKKQKVFFLYMSSHLPKTVYLGQKCAYFPLVI